MAIDAWFPVKRLPLMVALCAEAVLIKSAPPDSAWLPLNVLLLTVSEPMLLMAPPRRDGGIALQRHAVVERQCAAVLDCAARCGLRLVVGEGAVADR